ncbi:hypothetical protein BgiMline_026765 [Biomphalaria glabrata]
MPEKGQDLFMANFLYDCEALGPKCDIREQDPCNKIERCCRWMLGMTYKYYGVNPTQDHSGYRDDLLIVVLKFKQRLYGIRMTRKDFSTRNSKSLSNLY